MSEPFLGEIRTFGFNFAPQGWAMCNGQTMSISQNTALFSLLGTTYGGDGITTFALPNLQGRVGIHMSSFHPQGEVAGQEAHTLTSQEMPAHTHAINAGEDETTNRPAAAFAARGGVYTKTPNATMAPTGITGSFLPHNNMQPYLVLNFCIALEGIFPSRS
jgi:microcystin-dependent protein